MKKISYKKGYKYQLCKSYNDIIEIKPAKKIKTKYITLDTKGNLSIISGYAWDGPSGPTIDTPSFMRGALVHDALYQLMRGKHLDRKKHRDVADKILRRMCKEDGMWSARAWWVYQAVHLFADPAADPANKKPVLKAPK